MNILLLFLLDMVFLKAGANRNPDHHKPGVFVWNSAEAISIKKQASEFAGLCRQQE
jgi:hypothetical protein